MKMVCFCATSSEMSGEMMMAHERIRDEILKGKWYFSMHAEENPQVGRGPVLMTTTELRAHNR